jgi:subtilisin family serine protease
VRRRVALVVCACTVAVLGLPPAAAADSVRDRQWHLAALGVSEAHRLTRGEGVVVAVVDTGVDDRSGELAGAVLPGKEFGERPTGDGRTDTDGHGTAVAGIIAGRGLPNGGGILGIAPGAEILPVQTLHSEFGGSPADLGKGVDWAVSRGADVICIAAGTSEYGAVSSAVVAAAGNAPGEAGVAFPARLPGVVAVAGTNRAGDHAAVSVIGPEVLLAAPAVDIISTTAFGKYVTSQGTSNSAAIVAGVVALVRAKFPGLSAVEVVRRLTVTATDRGKPGRDEEFGFGIVNPVAALTASDVGVSGSPMVTGSPSRPGVPGVGRGVVWVVIGAGVVLVGGWLVAARRRRR